MKLQYVGNKKHIELFDYINYFFMLILCFIFIYPLFMTLSLSFSDPKVLVGRNVYFFPVGFSLDSYTVMLSDKSILRYYLNTLIYAFSGTLVRLVLTSLMAYPLTFQKFKAKKFITVLLIITMFFSGGLIPSYLVVKSYNMLNTIWAMILPGAISAWNVIIFRTFFLTIPESLRESAYIDGAGHFRVLASIVIPLSKPLFATIALFSLVGYWNSYFDALIYLQDSGKMPIQILLRSILVSMEYQEGRDMSRFLDAIKSNPRTLKAAATIVTITPILCVYPFLQKYFTKGILLGSVKA